METPENNDAAETLAKDFFEGQVKLDDLTRKVSRAGLLRAFNIVTSFPFIGESVKKLNNVHEIELVKTALHLRGLADGFMKTEGMTKEALETEVVDNIVESVVETTKQQGDNNNGSGQE